MTKKVTFGRPRGVTSVRDVDEAVVPTAKTDNTTGAEKTPSFTPPLRGGVKKEGSSAKTGNEEKKNVVDTLLADAERLSKAERKELLARLSLAVASDSARRTDDRDLTMWAEAVYRAMDDAQAGSDGAGQGPLVLKRLLAAVQNWEPLAELLERSKLSSATVTQRQALYHMLAQTLVEHAKRVCSRMGIPLSAKVVANNAANITAIFESAFPGYLSSGLALVVAQRMQREHTDGN